MVYASGHKNRKRGRYNNDKIIEHVPWHISEKQHSNIIKNEKMAILTPRSSDLCNKSELGGNIRSGTKEVIMATKIVTQTKPNDWILKSSADVLHNFRTVKPINVLCCMLQSNNVVCTIKDSPDEDSFPKISAEINILPIQICIKQEIVLSCKCLTDNEYSPNAILESKVTNVNIFELLPYIRAMCKHLQLTHEKPQRAVAQGQILPTSLVQKTDQIPTKIILVNDLRVIKLNNEVKSKTNIKLNSFGSDKLFKPMPTEFQMTSCLRICNKILTDFIKMYYTIRNESFTSHKIVPSIYFHNWHFRNLTQGYILKCLLIKGQITALNLMRNLYFIIITKLASTSKIDIFFELHDGIFLVLHENYLHQFSQNHILNIVSTDALVDNMDVNKDSNHDNILNSQGNSEESDSCSTSSSLYSVPRYPSESTLFIEEEIKSWHQLTDETLDFETKVNDSFTSSDPKKEMYLNFWCNIYQLANVMNNLKRNTSDIVYCYTTDVLSKYEIFNENLFHGKSFDSLFIQDLRKFGTTFLQTLGKSLAYTMFSYVL